jgi:hypothetical protein
MHPRETISQFDQFLASRGLRFEATVIGGTALGLLGVSSRQTRDCDVLHPMLPPEIREAAREFAAARRSEGDSLVDDWLNNGPSSLIANLPEGWERRSQRIFDGHALTLHALGRIDFLMSKLFALCDRGIDLSDCIALAPTSGELREILPWLERQDANPDWPAHVRAVLDDLERRLGDGL